MDEIEDIYELSPLQQGLLFHSVYTPGTGLYIVQFCYQLQGSLDAKQLRRAWQDIVERHQALRTSFYWEDIDKPVQIVYQQVDLPWEEEDWTEVAVSARKTHLDDFLLQDRMRGFVLTQAPLLRLTLVRLASDAFYLIWSCHHIVLDGWSGAQVIKEVFELYTAYTQNLQPELEATRPYGAYIEWLQRQDMAMAEAFWRQRLKNFLSPTPLCVDHAPHEEMDMEEGSEEVILPESTATRLRAFARSNQLTLGTLLQGTWALLLSNYSQEQDIVFGVVISGRPVTLVGAEAIVGLFVNTLPLRAHVSADAPLLPWLKELQEQLIELQHYEYSSLTQIQGWSDVPRGQPLFNSLITLENYAQDAQWNEVAGLDVQVVRVVEKTHYPLAALVTADQEISLEIKYDSRRFDPPVIKCLLGHWQTLLDGVMSGQTHTLADVPLLTEAERKQILQEWNATTAIPPDHTCIHQFFEAQAASTPEAIALVCGSIQLSYSYLNRQANHLAHRLQRQGVGPEVLVGLALPRSPLLLMGLLAIVKAGGAYVPLDPHYPAERLHFILQDTAVKLVLTTSTLSREMAGVSTLPITPLLLDRCMEEADEQDQSNPQSTVGSQNLAYVIYTSGSTGRPKGALLAHSGLCNLLLAQRQSFKQARQSRILQFASLNFDASIFEIVMAWGAGATLHLTAQETLQSGVELAHLMEEEAITTLTIPPSALTALLQEARLPQLQTLICAGEACPAELVARWAPGRAMYNAYGPTETTVWATVQPCQVNGQAPSIGRPIRNSQLYLLDLRMHPVPVGVPGELYIGGMGPARGYLGRAELSAERFVPHPYSQEPGARLYKTGDVGRYLPSGEIEYLGRNDEQVKLRGYRIELGEINALLSQHPAILQAIVLMQEGESGAKNLVAYVVPKNTEDLDEVRARELIAKLRLYLQERLPQYMIPTAIVPQSALPLNASGKVDRQALAALRQMHAISSANYVAPQTVLELLCVQIWQEILGTEKIGIYDNFFELGGHSLLIIQFHSKLQQALKRNVPLVDLFKYSTIHALTAYLEQEETKQQDEHEHVERIAQGKNRSRQRLSMRRSVAER